jgi:hypothetical protein
MNGSHEILPRTTQILPKLLLVQRLYLIGLGMDLIITKTPIIGGTNYMLQELVISQSIDMIRLKSLGLHVNFTICL